jgi:hydroxypyruvate isomerase
MKRRSVINAGLAALGAATVGAAGAAGARAQTAAAAGASNSAKFKLKYAPHFGMFKEHAGNSLVDQVKFIADQGFRAIEDNGMMKRPVAEQEAVAKEMERQGLEMGVFVAYGDFKTADFGLRKPEFRELLKTTFTQAVETAKRVNARWCTVVPGAINLGLQPEYQTANVIDNLKYCCEICEPAGLVMVLESLNWWANHPGLFLQRVPQAYLICRGVGSPSCKILDDLYHQQISEGHLIPNMDAAWEEIAYFQTGDNPGRKEPTTGEINYRNIFKHIHDKGFDGIIGMEHGNSKPGKAGELAVIAAYRECDNF